MTSLYAPARIDHDEFAPATDLAAGAAKTARDTRPASQADASPSVCDIACDVTREAFAILMAARYH